jgi:hypothetical protein
LNVILHLLRYMVLIMLKMQKSLIYLNLTQRTGLELYPDLKRRKKLKDIKPPIKDLMVKKLRLSLI